MKTDDEPKHTDLDKLEEEGDVENCLQKYPPLDGEEEGTLVNLGELS